MLNKHNEIKGCGSGCNKYRFVKVSKKVCYLSTQVCKSEYETLQQKRSKKFGGTLPLDFPEGIGI